MAPSKLNTKTFPSIPCWYSVTTKMTAELLRRCSLRAKTTYQHLSVESVIVNHLMAKAVHDIDALKVRASEMGRPLKHLFGRQRSLDLSTLKKQDLWL